MSNATYNKALAADGITHILVDYSFEHNTILTLFVGNEADCKAEQRKLNNFDTLIVALSALPDGGIDKENEFLAVQFFKHYGMNASHHYADDSTKEWKYGDVAKDKAYKIAAAYPQCEESFVKVSQRFLWSFSPIGC